MTTNSSKNKTQTKVLIAVIASILLSLGILMTQNVSAAPAIGLDKVQYELKVVSSPELDKAREILSEIDAGVSEQRKANLMSQVKILEQQSIDKASKMNSAAKAQLEDKRNILSDHMAQQYSQTTKGKFNQGLPIIGLSVNEAESALEVEIDSSYLTTANSASIIKQIRSIVGNEINIVLQSALPMQTTVCSQTGDCEPAKGGVKISTFTDGCSLGFKASFGGNTGFVTAGHCGNANDDVGQPNFVFWDDIGTITSSHYVGGSNCDCAFVNANENISDLIFSSINPGFVGGIVQNGFVSQEGYTTQGVFGLVTSTSWSGTVSGVWLNDLVKTSFVTQKGDSGGPMYDTVNSSLLGFASGSDLTSFSVNSKASNVQSVMPGLTWQFT